MGDAWWRCQCGGCEESRTGRMGNFVTAEQAAHVYKKNLLSKVWLGAPDSAANDGCGNTMWQGKAKAWKINIQERDYHRLSEGQNKTHSSIPAVLCLTTLSSIPIFLETLC